MIASAEHSIDVFFFFFFSSIETRLSEGIGVFVCTLKERLISQEIEACVFFLLFSFKAIEDKNFVNYVT